jgi:hypothetical protein
MIVAIRICCTEISAVIRRPINRGFPGVRFMAVYAVHDVSIVQRFSRRIFVYPLNMRWIIIGSFAAWLSSRG